MEGLAAGNHTDGKEWYGLHGRCVASSLLLGSFLCCNPTIHSTARQNSLRKNIVMNPVSSTPGLIQPRRLLLPLWSLALCPVVSGEDSLSAMVLSKTLVWLG